MPNQEQLAYLQYALAQLAKAPVAAYPESGAMMLANQATDVAQAKLAEEAQKKAQKKANKKNKKGGLIKAAATVAGTVVGGPVGGTIANSLASFAGGDVAGGVEGAIGAAQYYGETPQVGGLLKKYQDRKDKKMYPGDYGPIYMGGA